jgi:galactose mutarotase-like enzyme
MIQLITVHSYFFMSENIILQAADRWGQIGSAGNASTNPITSPNDDDDDDDDDDDNNNNNNNNNKPRKFKNVKTLQ